MFTLYDLPVDVLRIIGKRMGISQLTKLCIAVPKLDKLLADKHVEMYKTLIKYEPIPILLLKNTCQFNSAGLFSRVFLDFPKTGCYLHEIVSYCWKNNYLNVYDILINAYRTISSSICTIHYDKCEVAVLLGDMEKLKYIVEYYTDKTDGPLRCVALLELIKKQGLYSVDVYIHLINIGCIKSGIEYVIIDMCSKPENAENVEKLYNALHRRLDIDLMRREITFENCFKSLELLCFLNSVKLISCDIESVDNFDEYPKNKKKFVEKYGASPNIITMLLLESWYHENLDDVRYLIALEWQPDAEMRYRLNSAIDNKQYALLEILTPYVDKILSDREDVLILDSLVQHLYSIGYKSNNPRLVKRMQSISKIYASADKKIVDYLSHLA